ncbi:MAG: LVIVD repeat-containing protein [Trichloromonadaceae bacterium]
MPLRNTWSLKLVLSLALYLLVVLGLGCYLFWPTKQPPPLQVTRAGLAPEGDRILLEGQGFSAATQVSLSLDVNNQRLLRHSVPTYGRGADMVRVDGFAYALVRKKGLIVLDLADSQRPQVISTLELPGEMWTLSVNAGVAYIACGRGGLALVDVSDPHTPRLLATVPELQMVQGLAVQGGRLYASVYGRGVEPALAVVDVTTPSRPGLIGRVSLTGQPLGVALWGERLLIANAKEGLLCLDLGVGLPRLSARLPLPGWAQSLMVAGDHAYVACSSVGLAVVELATGTPRLLAHLPLAGRPNRLVLDGERLYLLGGGAGVQVIAIDSPALPRLLGSFSLREGASSLVAVNDTVLLNTHNDGLQVVDFRELSVLHRPDPDLPSGRIVSLSREGELLAVTTRAGELHLYQWRPGERPRPLATQPLPGKEQAVSLHAGYAYIHDARGQAEGQGLTVIDVREPLTPIVVGHYPLVNSTQPLENVFRSPRMALAGNRGALVDANGRLWLFSTDHPEALQFQPGPQFQGQVTELAWGDDLQLYAVSGSDPVITAIDFRDPHRPVVFPASPLPAKTIVHMATLGKLVVLACGLEGLITVDFSRPQTPRILALPLAINAFRVRVDGTVAVVGGAQGGLLQVDLRDRVRPRMNGLLSTPGTLTDFVVAEGQAVVAVAFGGLLVLPLPQTLQSVTQEQQRMTLMLPPIDTAGHYTLRLTDGPQTVVLPGALALAPR